MDKEDESCGEGRRWICEVWSGEKYEDDIEKVTEECGMKKEFYLKELNLS